MAQSPLLPAQERIRPVNNHALRCGKLFSKSMNIQVRTQFDGNYGYPHLTEYAVDNFIGQLSTGVDKHVDREVNRPPRNVNHL